MRILFLTQTTELGPASRYRVYQFLPALATAGVEYEVSPAILTDEYGGYFGGSALAKLLHWPRMFGRRRRDAARFGEFDAVFIQKKFPRWARLGGRIIYDFDDAVFGAATERVLRASTLVLAGNEFLAGYARTFAWRVEVMPTVVDAERFQPAAAPGKDAAAAMVLGWIGSRTTMKYLEAVAPALKEYRLRVVSSRPPGFACDFEPWSLEREVQQIQSFDVGLAPLADTEWERGKCGLKVLQYMACAVPVVASPVGVQREFVERSGGGLLAATPGEWREKVQWLSQRPEQRRAMGRKGRAFVEANYSVRVWAPRWIEVLRAAAGGK
jgi:glycosyltransferase involved in cell wall biosynthesis